MNLQIRISVLLIASFLPIPLVASAATINPDAVAYQDDPAHDGSVTFQNFSGTPVKQWSVNLGGSVSYPLIAQGEVYVTAQGPVGGINLFALNAKTGHTDWSVFLNSSGGADSAAYDNGDVFVFNNNSSSSTMNAYNAATGALLWSKPLANQSLFNSPPTASNGIVYTGGSGVGGTVYALSESNGATLWTAGVANGENSSPTVTSSGVYVSYVGPQTYDFNPTGGLIWQLASGVEGGGGKTTVYYNGNLYVRDIDDPMLPNQNLLLVNAATGQPSMSFQDTSLKNSTAPAFSNGRGYVEAGNGLLLEFNGTSGVVGWSLLAPDGGNDGFDTVPIIINGDVFEGTAEGLVYEFDGVSGNLLGMTNVGSDINGLNQINGALPQTGLGAGDGLLVVPAGDTLNVYSVVTVPEPPSIILAIAGSICVVGLVKWRRSRCGSIGPLAT